MTLLPDFWSPGHLELALLALVGWSHLQSESKTLSVYRALETADLCLLCSRGQTPDQKARDPSQSTQMGNCSLQLVWSSVLLSSSCHLFQQACASQQGVRDSAVSRNREMT